MPGATLRTVTLDVLYEGFEQAFERWQVVQYAPADPLKTFIPLFEVLEWAACIDERWGYEKASKELRGLRWARNRVYHGWALALEVRTRDELTLHPSIDRSSVPDFEWAWRDALPESKPVPERLRKDEPFYASHLAGQPARVTLNLIRAHFLELQRLTTSG